jgi:mannose-1-phosphate guanylyltransferase
MDEHRWAIILAAGDGSRIRPFMTDGEGHPIPKQFWPIEGRRTMLDWSIDRAEKLVARERIVVIVAEQHRIWWEGELQRVSPENVVVQPSNRGTAVGVLLPLLSVLRRDPDATILLLPSDHFVEQERTLRSAINDALRAAEVESSAAAVLMGMTPGTNDREYGWILPARRRVPEMATGVASFVEKPEAAEAGRLRRDGALINSFILTAKAQRLWKLCETTLPVVAESLRHVDPRPVTRAGRRALENAYSRLPSLDFSREVLSKNSSKLAVIPVPECGWSDLGTPARLMMFREVQARQVEQLCLGA